MLLAESDDFPYLDLRTVPLGRRMITAFRFARRVASFLEAHDLRARRTIIYKGHDSRPIGVSPWAIMFPATPTTLARITEILTRLEDKRFWMHRGIDWTAIARAAVRNMCALRIREGGSTLTQQLVRNVLLYPDRSVMRKLTEWVLALQLERKLGKQEILAAYCSLVFFGPGVRGVEAALRLYHRKTSQTASDAEIRAVTGCLRKPMQTSPLVDLAAYERRAQQIERFIGKRQTLAPTERRPCTPVSIRRLQKPRLAAVGDLEAKTLLACHTLPADIRHIHLTIDAEIQGVLDRAALGAFSDRSVKEVSGVIIRSATGEVVAESSFVEGRETYSSPAFRGAIQPGSTVKPFVLLEAIEQGFDIDTTVQSSPFVWRSPEFVNGIWRVRNHNHVYRGDIPLSEALVLSDNTCFARLAQMLNRARLIERLRVFGLIAPGDENISSALGAVRSGLSLLRLCRAYAGLSRGGYLHEPYVVRGVEFADGSLLHRTVPDPVEAGVSHRTLALLDSVLLRSGIRASTRKLRGKSGTAGRGSVFAGYDDELSYAIWVGFRGVRPEWWSKGLSAKSILGKVLDELSGRTPTMI